MSCREPTRCLRCGRPGHRSFKCRRPRRQPTSSRRIAPEPMAEPPAPPRKLLTGATGRAREVVVGSGGADNREQWRHQSTSKPTAETPAPPCGSLTGANGRAADATGDDVGAGSGQHRHRRRLRRGRRGSGRRRNPVSNQEDERHTPSVRRRSPSPPAPPSPTQDQLSALDACFINRTSEVDEAETILTHLSAFVQVVGTRPAVEPESVRRAIEIQFELDESLLEIRNIAQPEDFLVTFPNHSSLVHALTGIEQSQRHRSSFYSDHGAG